MLIFSAAAFSVLVGILGLAVDLGFVALERRTLQKAADAAAVAGALKLVDSSTWDDIDPTVAALVARNGAPAGTAIGCVLVDSAGAQRQANCGAPTDLAIGGVRVTLTHTRANFFMGVLGLRTVNVAASATAQTHREPTYDTGRALFIVCGYATKLAAGGTTDILDAGQRVRPAAVGQTFVLHGPQVSRCGAEAAFKGLNASRAVIDLPADLQYSTGAKVGPTTGDVAGPDGCRAGLWSDSVDDCVMLLPVAVSRPAAGLLHAVMWLPFRVRQVDANTHTGVLLGEAYLVRLTSPTSYRWTILTGGLVSARLTG